MSPALALALFLLAAVPKDGAPAQQSPQSGPSEKRGALPEGAAVSVVQTPGRQATGATEDEGKTKGQGFEVPGEVTFALSLIGAATGGASALYGFAQARAAHRQFEILKDQVDLSRAEFAIAHRPKIVPFNATSAQPRYAPGDAVRFGIYFRNEGDTVAKIVDARLHALWLNGGLPDERLHEVVPAQPFAVRSLAPGESFFVDRVSAKIDALKVGDERFTVVGAPDVPTSVFRSAPTPDWEFMVMGLVRYLDEGDRPYTRHFLFTLERDGEMRRSEHPEYN